jgi:hypothetical protein
MFWGNKESVIAPTKTFFNNLGSKLKTFVAEEQKVVIAVMRD